MTFHSSAHFQQRRATKSIPLKRVCTHRNEKHQVDFRLRHPLLSLSALMEVQPGIYTGPKPRTHTSLLASLPCLVPSSGKIISPSLMPFRACAQCTAAPGGTPNHPSHSPHSHTLQFAVLGKAFANDISYVGFNDIGSFSKADTRVCYKSQVCLLDSVLPSVPQYGLG